VDLDRLLSVQATYRHLKVEVPLTRWLEELAGDSLRMHSECILVNSTAVLPTLACHTVLKGTTLTDTMELIRHMALALVSGSPLKDLHLCRLELAILPSTTGRRHLNYLPLDQAQPLVYRSLAPLRTDRHRVTTPVTSPPLPKLPDPLRPLRTTLGPCLSNLGNLSRRAT